MSAAYLTYPENMSSEQDRIKFLAVSIGNDDTYKIEDIPIFIAVQAPISDQNGVDWGPDSLNNIDKFVYNKSLDLIQKGNPEAVFKETATDIYNEFKYQKERIEIYLAGQAAGVNNILARTDGIILNPNLELLFQGPQLRPFSFTFKMSARSQSEATIIKSIINYFKRHMAVRREESALFLKSPHVFTIQYKKGINQPHPGINVISPSDTEKACALTNLSVDYTPLGSYTTYQDGTMVAYTLNLQFQELTPIYADDYGSHPIGY